MYVLPFVQGVPKVKVKRKEWVVIEADVTNQINYNPVGSENWAVPKSYSPVQWKKYLRYIRDLFFFLCSFRSIFVLFLACVLRVISPDFHWSWGVFRLDPTSPLENSRNNPKFSGTYKNLSNWRDSNPLVHLVKILHNIKRIAEVFLPVEYLLMLKWSNFPSERCLYVMFSGDELWSSWSSPFLLL